MSGCCGGEPARSEGGAPAAPFDIAIENRSVRRRGRGREIAGWACTGVIPLLLPKCPACVAAYVALFTGVRISFSTAMYAKVGMLILCATLLLWLVAKRVRRMVA